MKCMLANITMTYISNISKQFVQWIVVLRTFHLNKSLIFQINYEKSIISSINPLINNKQILVKATIQMQFQTYDHRCCRRFTRNSMLSHVVCFMRNVNKPFTCDFLYTINVETCSLRDQLTESTYIYIDRREFRLSDWRLCRWSLGLALVLHQANKYVIYVHIVDNLESS